MSMETKIMKMDDLIKEYKEAISYLKQIKEFKDKEYEDIKFIVDTPYKAFKFYPSKELNGEIIKLITEHYTKEKECIEIAMSEFMKEDEHE